MKPEIAKLIFTFLLCSGSHALAKLTPEQAAQLPPPADHQVNFTREVQPILEASCVKCHGRGKAKGGFQLDTRETILKSSDSGPAVVPGKSAESYLIELVSGLDPDTFMPQKGSKLTPAQVGVLRAWIDQELPWDKAVSFAKPAPLNLQPSHVALPPAHRSIAHPIDRLLQPYFASKQVKVPKVVDDRVFARRVYLDVIGLLPAPDELKNFSTDRRRDKRERLVQHLLADNQRYAQHWLTSWNDALRNDYAGTGYIDGGRKQITSWLYSALANNLPYDKFVAQLINPTPDSEGFSKGIVWRGAVNASQMPPLQAAQNISQVFMGVNLKCASCHDSFINDWALADAYGLANIYADEPLEISQCDKPIGKKAATKFIYPELGAIDGQLDKAKRTQRLAEVICSPENGRLTRTIVNRLWARFMGRGLVEPVDDMEQPAWHGDLLDWLAEDLATHGYNLKRTIELILTSRAYQLPAVNLSERQQKDFVFQGPAVRRLSAEQFRDALGSLTGVWFEKPDGQFDFGAGVSEKPMSFAHGLKPRWIWSSANALDEAPVETVYWRKTITLADKPAEAFFVCTADNSFTLYVNGTKAGSGNEWEKPRLFDVRANLVTGENLIAIESANGSDKPNPAGLLFYARVRARDAAAKSAPERIMDFGADGTWRWTTTKKDGWEKAGFDEGDWKSAFVLDDSSKPHFQLEPKFASLLSGTRQYGKIRASLVKADPLAVALGRPNREQVITTRATAATTLQALELTNGNTLAKALKRGAEKLAANNSLAPQAFVEDLFFRALSRKPTAQELTLANELMSKPMQKEVVEDLLWSLTMLPEFQLIY